MSGTPPCFIPTDALETPGTSDEIAVRCGRPVFQVWRALQRDVKRGRVRTERGLDGVTRYAIADRARRNGQRMADTAEDDQVLIRYERDDRRLSKIRTLGDAVTWRDVAKKLRISRDVAKKLLGQVATWDPDAKVWRVKREEAA